MKKLILGLVCFLIITADLLLAGGQEEAGASATHGKYLAGQGIIVPPDDIRVNSYIAQIDYNYSTPDKGDFDVFLYQGNRLLSNQGQNEILHVGIKAVKTEFENLPPLNLAFVIDNSGSMASENKLDWVKESFYLFIDKVRDQDFVSLVLFSSQSEVLFPTTQMNSMAKREEFKAKVRSIQIGGGTNLRAGLENGYSQVLGNYRDDYNNRVLFLTDGVGNNEGLIEMAESYKDLGINVSTIGLGSNFDVNLMVDLAKAGGGSSRFISDREEMKETFSSELDRMIVPAARELNMILEVPEWAEIVDTWGYRNEKSLHSVKYSLPTLHNGDYETILTKIRILPGAPAGKREIGRFTVNYQSLENEPETKGPYIFEAELISDRNPVYGVSSYTVLQSSTMLYIAESLIRIGQTYYQTRDMVNQVNSMRDTLWYGKSEEERNNLEDPEATYDELNSEEITLLENEINTHFRQALDITVETRKNVLNNRMKLDDIGFEDELEILDNYVKILAEELKLNEEKVSLMKSDIEPHPVDSVRTLNQHVELLFREVLLSLSVEESATIAIIPFMQQGAGESGLTEYLNLSATRILGENQALNLLDRAGLDAVLEEQKLALSGLVDTEQALSIGQLMSAHYLLTGNIIPMSQSIVVFSRVINVETGEVETVSQIVIPMNDDLKSMLEQT